MCTTTNANPFAAAWASDDDGSVIKEHCSQIFFGKWEGLHIARAVQQKMKVGDCFDEASKVQTI